MNAPCLPGLLEERLPVIDTATGDVARAPLAWKVVSKVSIAQYRWLEEHGGLTDDQRAAVRTIAAIRNRKGKWRTCAELTRVMHWRGLIPRNDPRLVAPRITELVKGKVVAVGGEKVRKGGGFLCYGTLRRCTVTKTSAREIEIREAGSEQREIRPSADAQEHP